MGPSPGRYRLALLGPFRLTGPDDERIDITSRRGMALIAMLALSRDGERTRAWLQERLWGSRAETQAQGSLRTELSELRKRLNRDGPPLISAGHERVRLDLSQLDVDVRAAQTDEAGPEPAFVGELLEGLEIPGEDGFETWLAEHRQALERARERAWDASPRAGLPGPVAGRRGDAAPEAEPTRLLAVLPFDNRSGDPQMDHFAVQLSETIQIAVCRVEGLNVIGRASTFQLQGEARAPEAVLASLGATHLLDGSVRKSGDRVRITAALVACASRATLWSEHYDRDLAAPFDLQDDIAGAVAAALQVVFSSPAGR